jgi:hypothetical protein
MQKMVIMEKFLLGYLLKIFGKILGKLVLIVCINRNDVNGKYKYSYHSLF